MSDADRIRQLEAERDAAIRECGELRHERDCLDRMAAKLTADGQEALAQRDGAVTACAKLREALESIRRDNGKVCANFELCHHIACASSYSSWATADEALRTTDVGAPLLEELRLLRAVVTEWDDGECTSASMRKARDELRRFDEAKKR